MDNFDVTIGDMLLDKIFNDVTDLFQPNFRMKIVSKVRSMLQQEIDKMGETMFDQNILGQAILTYMYDTNSTVNLTLLSEPLMSVTRNPKVQMNFNGMFYDMDLGVGLYN